MRDPSVVKQELATPAGAFAVEAEHAPERTGRPGREPDHPAENRLLLALTQQLADAPEGLPQRLAAAILEACRAGSAGISVVDETAGTCRWHTVTGELGGNSGASFPLDLCPTGTAVPEDGVRLYVAPAERFPALAGLEPRVTEYLVAPFFVAGVPAGALWAAHHAPERQFDAEDARLLQCLARFAAAGLRLAKPAVVIETPQDEGARRMTERTAVLEEVFQSAPSFLHVLRGPEFIFEFANEAYYQLVGRRDLIGRPAFQALPEAAAAGYEEHISGVMTTKAPFYGHELSVTLARTPGAPPEERIIDLVYLPLLDPDGTCTRVLGHGTDVTDHVRARVLTEAALRESEAQRLSAALRENEAQAVEAVLRENEARQGYLLRLGDELRALSDPLEIQEAAARLLGEHLQADRVMYGEVEGPDDEAYVIRRNFCRAGTAPFLGRHCFADFGAQIAATLRAGYPLEVADVCAHPDGADHLSAYDEAEIRSYVAVPLIKEGRIAAYLAVNQRIPRAWSAQEVALVAETAERTWAAVARARAEVAIREAVERYERQVRLFDGVASTTPDFVYLFDLEGQFRYANRRLLEVWGMALPDVIGKTCLELGYEPWHHEMHMREIAQVIETKQPIKGEVPFKAPLTGVFGVYEYIFTPVLGPDGEVELIAGTTRDITERRQAADALQESARRKDEFLATLAHELRNPLAPMVNALEVLRLRASDPVVVDRSRETIRRQVDHMRRLVDDLLDVARITRGMVELKVETVELGNVLTGAVQMVRPLIDLRKQEFTVSVPLESVRLPGDPHRLTQVLTNLLTNAAKFTPEGGQLSVIAEHRDAEVVIRVRDTGKGIPAEVLPHIFDLFTQVNPSIDRAEGGLGLGLTLVQKLVEMHGGRVEAQSAGPGQGSEFSVRLPAHPRVTHRKDRANASSRPALARKSLRILAVDDNTDAADTFAELLPLWGHQVQVAYTGPEALARAREYRPDLVLLDIGLPGMDGYTVARQIRKDPSLASIRLVAVTGFGQDADRRQAQDAGFDDYLTKPVDPDELRRLLESMQLVR